MAARKECQKSNAPAALHANLIVSFRVFIVEILEVKPGDRKRY